MIITPATRDSIRQTRHEYVEHNATVIMIATQISQIDGDMCTTGQIDQIFQLIQSNINSLHCWQDCTRFGNHGSIAIQARQGQQGSSDFSREILTQLVYAWQVFCLKQSKQGIFLCLS